MRKFVAIALASIGIAAASMGAPARAGVAVSVGVPLPGVVVAAPPLVTPWPYYYSGPRYPGYVRFGYGAPYAWRHGYHPGYWGHAHWRAWR